MPSQRGFLFATLALIVCTSLWFMFSSSSVDPGSLNISSSDNKVFPPAVTVFQSTCQFSVTSTILETATVTQAIQATHISSTNAVAEAEDLNGSPADTNPTATEPTFNIATIVPEDDENFNLTEALTKYSCYPASIKEIHSLVAKTVPSINFNPVRGDNLLLNRKIQYPADGKDISTWYSVGRKPTSGCWTYNDRFGPYTTATPRFLRTLGNVNGCNPDNKRTFLLRIQKGQSWNTHFIHHVRSLIAEAGWAAEYHFHILTFVDGPKSEKEEYVNNVIPEPFRPLVYTYNTEDLQNFLGPETPYTNYTSNEHVAVQKFMHDNAKYEFAYFVDANVRMIGRWDDFLKSVDDEYAFHRELKSMDSEMAQMPDLVTFEVTREPPQAWEGLEWKCAQFFRGEKVTIRRSLPAMGGYSKKMIQKLGHINSRKISCHSEYFVPSVAGKEGLTTFFYQHALYTRVVVPESNKKGVLEGNDVVTVQSDGVAVDYSYSGEDREAQDFWEEWVNNSNLCRPQALLHPVKKQY